MRSPAIITRPKSATTYRRGRKAKGVLVGAQPGRVKIKVRLTDGQSNFVVEDEDRAKLGGPWFKLYNEDLPEGKHEWFRLEDLHPLAVILR